MSSHAIGAGSPRNAEFWASLGPGGKVLCEGIRPGRTFGSARAVSPTPLLSLPRTAIRDRRPTVFLEDFAGLEMHLMHFSGLMEKPRHKWASGAPVSAISERGSSCPAVERSRAKKPAAIALPF